MTGKLIVPSDTEQASTTPPEIEAAVIVVKNLGPILQGIQNQLDLLIRMECGVAHRTKVRKNIQRFDLLKENGLLDEETGEEVEAEAETPEEDEADEDRG